MHSFVGFPEGRVLNQISQNILIFRHPRQILSDPCYVIFMTLPYVKTMTLM
jgi:hypothetical protein